MSALGPGWDFMRVRRCDDFVAVTFSPTAADVLEAVAAEADGDDENLAPWIDLVAPALVDELTVRLGREWVAEIELGVELLLAERTSDFGCLARMARQGPVVVSVDSDAAEVLAADVLAAGRTIMLIAS